MKERHNDETTDQTVTAARIVLASASPRRQLLLRRLGLPFEVVPSDVDETVAPGVTPVRAAEELALRKARAVALARPGQTVIGADTIVALGAEAFGKPRDEPEALQMLRRLGGRTHQVATGVAVVRGRASWHTVVTARVTMRRVPDDQLRAYIATGEPLDKAGAYAVQGWGSFLIEALEGSELAVVGLPLLALAGLLVASGLTLPIVPEQVADSWEG